MAYLEAAEGYTIFIDQNASYNLVVGLYGRVSASVDDITGWGFTASIKQNYSDPSPTMFFSCSSTMIPSASVSMSLTAAQTWALTDIDNRFVYDLIANNTTITPQRTYRLLQGKIKINPGVTAP